MLKSFQIRIASFFQSQTPSALQDNEPCALHCTAEEECTEFPQQCWEPLGAGRCWWATTLEFRKINLDSFGSKGEG